MIMNMGKNVIMIDRAPLFKDEERILHHKSLILIGDDATLRIP
jgi:hypothetical protein